MSEEAPTAAMPAGPAVLEPAELAILQQELAMSQSTSSQKCMPSRELAALAEKVYESARADETESLTEGSSDPATSTAIECRICLQRGQSSQRFGVACANLAAAYASSCFVVMRILEGGQVEAWNDTCHAREEPWRRIHVASAILSVNGVCGDIKRMQQELETATAVSLTFCNPPSVLSFCSVLRAVSTGTELPSPHLFWRESAKRLLTEHGMQMQMRTSSLHLNASKAANLSVIVTTSPVPSNPSTEMLDRVLASMQLVPGLGSAPKIIVCDGCKCVPPGNKTNHKAGKVTIEEAQRYEQFIERLREKSAESCSCEDVAFFGTQVLSLSDHHGFGFAVKAALAHITTDYVLVVQHDQEFIAGFDLEALLETMSLHPGVVKYVGLPSVSTLNYEHAIRSKYGLSLHCTTEFGVPLTPLIFFYDKPHVCSTTHYRTTIFGPGSPVRKGDFIEETLGVAEREDILQNGAWMEAHAKYGTFQLDYRDLSDRQLAVIRHVNGRAFLSPEQRVAKGWTATLRFVV
ncbi:unnamed protein product [Symbiodinium sp. CCMP2456]|nr:unnamed protein product [Symbiodinium sp. CCMP2456]